LKISYKNMSCKFYYK